MAEAVLALKLVGIERTLAFLDQALLTLLGSQHDKELSILEARPPFMICCDTNLGWLWLRTHALICHTSSLTSQGLFAKHLALRRPNSKVLAVDGSADALEHGKTEAPAVPCNLTLQVADWNEVTFDPIKPMDFRSLAC